ncbi:hypothetical protein DPMN_051260 [Dreissena polymorpha]|uniref:Uncharacterized protein n=1 Tax=Dreissena polymorpha TaxID=45954 RepID=A0A9D4HLZ8_DREPO|nr:hypothetical protein DPMN_051260 [Dreissena polymorpha]
MPCVYRLWMPCVYRLWMPCVYRLRQERKSCSQDYKMHIKGTMGNNMIKIPVMSTSLDSQNRFMEAAAMLISRLSWRRRPC